MHYEGRLTNHASTLLVGAMRNITRRSALVMLGSVAGCSPTRPERTVTMWAMSTEGENAPLLLLAFERETGLRVNLQSLPWTAAHDKMLTAYAGGSLPDVMMVSNAWLPEFVAIGALEPLPVRRRSLLTDQFPAVARQMQIGVHDWGLPWVVGTQAQFYRRDMLEAAGYDTPPERWDAWKEMLHAVRQRNQQGYALLMLLNWPEHLMGFAAQQPDPLLRDRNSRGNFSSPGFRAALGFYKSLFDEALAPKVVSTEIGDPLALFAQGWFAVYPAPPYAAGDLALPERRIPRSLWSTAPLPGPEGLADAIAGGNSLVVSKGALNPEGAWRLIDFLCQPTTQIRFHALTGDLPSRPSAWTAISNDPVIQTFATQMARTVAAPAVPEWERIQTEVQTIADRMVRGGLTVNQAAKAMDGRADALLAKRRWLLDHGRIT